MYLHTLSRAEQSSRANQSEAAVTSDSLHSASIELICHNKNSIRWALCARELNVIASHLTLCDCRQRCRR